MNFVAVDIGARDGKVDDPVYTLKQSVPSLRMVAYEGQPKMCPRLRSNLDRNATIVCPVFLTPHNVLSMLEDKGAVPRDVDVMKIDIDSCDAMLLDLILQGGYRPKVIQIEVNQYVPPPLLLGTYCGLSVGTKLFEAPLSLPPTSGKACLNSNSAAYVDRVVRGAPVGYRLLQFDWPDLVYVRHDFASSFSHRLPSDVGRVFHIGVAHARQHYPRYKRQMTDARCEAWDGLLANKGRAGMYEALLQLKTMVREHGVESSTQPMTIGLDVGSAPHAGRGGTVSNVSIGQQMADL